MDVFAVSLVILEIAHAMVAETRLPDRAAGVQTERESSLDELHGAFKRDFRRGCKQRVNMVRHDDKFVEKKFSLVAIVRESFGQKVSRRFLAKDRTSLRGYGCDEEDAVEIHPAMMIFA